MCLLNSLSRFNIHPLHGAQFLAALFSIFLLGSDDGKCYQLFDSHWQTMLNSENQMTSIWETNETEWWMNYTSER